MKAVMMSIQPKWCELIASGKKTVEVRKTKPKLETPFKVYIYETKDKNFENISVHWVNGKDFIHSVGKVIGEFVCDVINPIYSQSVEKQALCAIADGNGDKEYYENSCVSYKEVYRYLKNVKMGYGWHISDLVIYDEPKELSEFYRLGKLLICDGRNCENCNHLKYMQVNSDEWDYDCDCQHQLENRITLKRPPQSWCYVEELR